MSLAKEAQYYNLDGVFVTPEEFKELTKEDTGDLQVELELDPSEEKYLEDHKVNLDGEVTLTVEDDEGKEVEEVEKEFHFSLPNVPGAEDQADLQVEEQDEIEVESDPWKWTPKTFLSWLKNKVANIPSHSGKDTAGIERAISYLEMLDKEISKAARMDINNEIDINALETAREEIRKGIQRLKERLDKLHQTRYSTKKRASYQEGFTKEAGDFYGIQVNVPLFISYVARVCVNAMISGGHDIEECFKKMTKKHKLTDREQIEVLQVLSDWGAIAVSRDRGIGPNEDFDPSSPDNYDWAAGWQS